MAQLFKLMETARLTGAERSNLADSRFPQARLALESLTAFAEHGTAADLSNALREFIALEGAAAARLSEVAQETKARDAELAAGLDMSRPDTLAMQGASLQPARALVAAIGRLQAWLEGATTGDAHAIGCDIAAAAFALHSEAQRLHSDLALSDSVRHALNASGSDLAEIAAGAVRSVARLERERDAAQARANNAETREKETERKLSEQTARYNALHARYAELAGAVATVAAHAALIGSN